MTDAPLSLRVSVLDQSPIAEGASGSDALHNSVDLAQLADQLGYHRYWVAEHHGTPMLACASPEALIGPIAASTRRIRVGSGGVMLPHYSPLKVAETFSMLAGLYPGRIDLAVGRAPGTDPATTFALQRDRRHAAPDDFAEQLVELLGYLSGTMPDNELFARLTTLPGRPERPDPWLLGSSPQSGMWAAQLGLPYAFADFINPTGAAVARRYQETFRPSDWRAAPDTLVAMWAVCAETDAEAERLAASTDMAFALLQRGQLIPVPPVETALRFLEGERARGALPGRQRRRIVGAPTTVRTGIEAVAREYGADEVMVVTITYEHAARRRSYELIAEAFGLRAAPGIAAPAPAGAGL
ncbi:MAG TPA: LLM class flavin-dependent oxidoreductase [Gemmatimonadales bacterium]|nr:LLM class flavin-dependent oxidoreductase [Gemmatimonadales bacterium]